MSHFHSRDGQLVIFTFLDLDLDLNVNVNGLQVTVARRWLATRTSASDGHDGENLERVKRGRDKSEGVLLMVESEQLDSFLAPVAPLGVRHNVNSFWALAA